MSDDENIPPISWQYVKYIKVRMAIVYILPHAVGVSKKRCPMKFLVNSLNAIVGPKAIKDYTQFTENIIRNAFTCRERKDFLVRCNAITDDENHTGVLHVRCGRQGSHRKKNASDPEESGVYDLCLFQNMQSAMEGQNNAAAARVMTETMINEIEASVVVVPKDLKRGLINFLSDEKKEKMKADAKAIKKRAALENKMDMEEKKRRQSVDIEEEEDTTGNAMIQSLRAQVDKIRIRQNEILAELESINQSLGMAVAELSKAIGSASCDVVDGMYDYSCDSNTNSSMGDWICLQYYYNGRSGVLYLVGDNQILVEADFVKGFLPLVETSSDTSDTQLPILKTQPISQMQYFVPALHKLSIKNREKEREDSKAIVSNILSRFNKTRCTWDDVTKGIFTIMNSIGYGCSDEATVFIMGGTLAGFFQSLNIDITATQIANALPSRSTLANWEFDVAADCLLGLCWQMKKAGLTQLALTTDHGHRKGQDHLVKVLSYPDMTKSGHLTIGNFCLDVDQGGHTTIDAAEAIKLSVLPFLDILNRFINDDEGSGVKLSVITGDAGGGASVQYLHPELMKLKLMGDDSKRLSCDMHNLNKAFEIACTDSWGRQGIGHNTVYQMLYLQHRIHKLIRQDYTRPIYSDAYAQTVDMLRNDPVWQMTALKLCSFAFEDFMNRLEALEEGDDDDIDLAVKIANFAPSNLHEPVQTRWGSVSDSIRFFADNWVVIYFFTRTLVSTGKCNSQLTKTTCALLSLMHNYEFMPTRDCDDMESYIDSFTSLDISEVVNTKWTMSSPTPILQAVLYFLDGFVASYFTGKQSHSLPRSLLASMIAHIRFIVVSRRNPQTCSAI
jgi:hypothetical protein